MAAQADLHSLLYLSTLAPGADILDVAKIATVSRIRNAADRITGILVFDGASFGQLVEGPQDGIAALLGRLQRDPRHTDMDVQVFGLSNRTRRFPTWNLGYHFAADERNELASLRGLRRDEAFSAFEKLIADVDVGAGQAAPA